MLQAFQEIGYDVDCVMGYGRERRKKIHEIKKKIENGVKYDFMYSESSTMPTVLTEKNHIPRYFTLDFGFIKFCKKHGIRIGLFYRDIQWKFDVYKQSVSLYKRCVTIPMYYYDLYKYQQLVDRLYLTSFIVKRYLRRFPSLLEKIDELPPGCDRLESRTQKPFDGGSNDILKIFYVGGISRIYDLEEFLLGVQNIEHIELIICCREQEWKEEKSRYEKYLLPWMKIVHASGKELEPFYEWADICCGFAGKGAYMSIAMPIKIFEYLGHGKPIIGTAGTEAGNFIEKTNIGWCVQYHAHDLEKCIKEIQNNPLELETKKKNIYQIQKENYWTSRAQKVINDLL